LEGSSIFYLRKIFIFFNFLFVLFFIVVVGDVSVIVVVGSVSLVVIDVVVIIVVDF